MGQKDLPPVKLSQRSNGLAFSQYHHLSTPSGATQSTQASKRVHTSALFSRNSKSSAVAREPSQDEPKKLDVIRVIVPVQRKVVSLIPVTVQPQRNLQDATRQTISGSKLSTSSAVSVHSFSSSVYSRKRKLSPVTTLETLPFDIKHRIFSCLPQETLRCLMLTSTMLAEAAAVSFYERPWFASTYRFAQFVTTVSNSLNYAQLVRLLDLSEFRNGAEDEPIAGWREWKYRNEPLYSLHQGPETNAEQAESEKSGSFFSSRRFKPTSHPKSNPFLRQWSTCRDVPVGAIVHVIQACRRIRFLDLSNLSIAADYTIDSHLHPATAFTSLIFVSDVPKSWTWKGGEVQQIRTSDMIQYITKLPVLETLRIKKGFWLSRQDVELLVRDCPRLERVNFQESGMKLKLAWARKGSRGDIQKILQDMSTTSKLKDREGTTET